MKKVTRPELFRWRDNSLSLASKLGYDPQVLETVRSRTIFDLVDNLPKLPGNPSLIFGICRYGPTNCLIEVQRENVSTLLNKQSVQAMLPFLGQIGALEEEIKEIEEVLEGIPEETFYETFNQSGMDHELMGHAYDYFSEPGKYSFFNGPSEDSAVRTQLRFARERAKENEYWQAIFKIMPKVLRHLKNIPGVK